MTEFKVFYGLYEAPDDAKHIEDAQVLKYSMNERSCQVSSNTV